MPKVLLINKINEVRQTVIFYWGDVKKILHEKANELTGLQHTQAVINSEEETEGSPPYKVGIKITVSLVKEIKATEA